MMRKLDFEIDSIHKKKDTGGMLMINVHSRFIVLILVVISITALVSCSKSTIKENEVGIVVSGGGSYKIYRPGEEASVMPFFQTFHVISTSPAILSLVGDEGVQVPLSKKEMVTIESQVTYFIDDVEKVINTYGIEDAHTKIREQIKSTVSKLIAEGFGRTGSFNETPHRIQIMAETNITLNEVMNPNGVSVSSFNIRHE